MYYESYWISGYVNDAFKRSYFRMPRSHFRLHHMLIILLFLPLQRCENSEGGPPCNSMPLVRLGLTICVIKCSYCLVRHHIYKLMLLFCLGSSRQSLKVRKVNVPSLSCKVVLSAMLAMLCCVCGTAVSVRLLVYAGLSLFIIGGPYIYMVVCVLYVYNLTIVQS